MLRNSGGATREVALEWVEGACKARFDPVERSFDDVEAGGIYWWMFVLLNLLIYSSSSISEYYKCSRCNQTTIYPRSLALRGVP